MAKLFWWELKGFFKRPRNLIVLLLLFLPIIFYIIYGNVNNAKETDAYYLKIYTQNISNYDGQALNENLIYGDTPKLYAYQDISSLLNKTNNYYKQNDSENELATRIEADRAKLQHYEDEGITLSFIDYDATAVENELNKLLYLQENNLQFVYEPTAMNALNFIRQFSISPFYYFLIVTVIYLACDNLYYEQEQGALKTLVTLPISRWKIELVRILAILIGILTSVFLILGLCTLLCLVINGYGISNYPVAYLQAGISSHSVELPIIYEYFHLSTYDAYFLRQLLLVIVALVLLALLASVLLNNSIQAIIAMVIFIFGSDQLFSLLNIPQFSIFKYFDTDAIISGANLSLNNNQITLTFGLIILGLFSLLFLIGSLIIFTKKDLEI